MFVVTEVRAGTKVTQVMSSSYTSSGKWEAELDGDADMSECLETPEVAAKESNLCQQFSSEMNKKFEVRARTSMEVVTMACEYTHTHTYVLVFYGTHQTWYFSKNNLNCPLRGCKNVAKSLFCV